MWVKFMRGPRTRFLGWRGLGLLSAIFSLGACSGDESPSHGVNSSGGGGAGNGGQPTGDSGGSTTGGAGTKPNGSGGASTTDASRRDASLSDASVDVIDAGGSSLPEAHTVGSQGGTLVYENGNVT